MTLLEQINGMINQFLIFSAQSSPFLPKELAPPPEAIIAGAALGTATVFFGGIGGVAAAPGSITGAAKGIGKQVAGTAVGAGLGASVGQIAGQQITGALDIRDARATSYVDFYKSGVITKEELINKLDKLGFGSGPGSDTNAFVQQADVQLQEKAAQTEAQKISQSQDVRIRQQGIPEGLTPQQREDFIRKNKPDVFAAEFKAKDEGQQIVTQARIKELHQLANIPSVGSVV